MRQGLGAVPGSWLWGGSQARHSSSGKAGGGGAGQPGSYLSTLVWIPAGHKVAGIELQKVVVKRWAESTRGSTFSSMLGEGGRGGCPTPDLQPLSVLLTPAPQAPAPALPSSIEHGFVVLRISTEIA